jgi:hypothetical protein
VTQQLFFGFNPNKKKLPVPNASWFLLKLQTTTNFTNYGISHVQLKNYSIQKPGFKTKLYIQASFKKYTYISEAEGSGSVGKANL